MPRTRKQRVISSDNIFFNQNTGSIPMLDATNVALNVASDIALASNRQRLFSNDPILNKTTLDVPPKSNTELENIFNIDLMSDESDSEPESSITEEEEDAEPFDQVQAALDLFGKSRQGMVTDEEILKFQFDHSVLTDKYSEYDFSFAEDDDDEDSFIVPDEPTEDELADQIAILDLDEQDILDDDTRDLEEVNSILQQETISDNWFEIFDAAVFQKSLAGKVTIEWSNRLSSTAGKTHLKSDYSCKITLSRKVLNTRFRVRNTLAHELCHAACWIIDRTNGKHGSLWKSYVQDISDIFPSLSITTKHSYSINWSYKYTCRDCGHVYGRNRPCINTKISMCHCTGRLYLPGYAPAPIESEHLEDLALELADIQVDTISDIQVDTSVKEPQPIPKITKTDTILDSLLLPLKPLKPVSKAIDRVSKTKAPEIKFKTPPASPRNPVILPTPKTRKLKKIDSFNATPVIPKSKFQLYQDTTPDIPVTDDMDPDNHITTEKLPPPLKPTFTPPQDQLQSIMGVSPFIVVKTKTTTKPSKYSGIGQPIDIEKLLKTNIKAFLPISKAKPILTSKTPRPTNISENEKPHEKPLRKGSLLLQCGFADTQGRRKSMEDSFFIAGKFNRSRVSDLFGVFDGHGGHHTALFCSRYFPLIFKKQIQDWPIAENLDTKVSRVDFISKAIANTLQELDDKVKVWSKHLGTTALVAYQERNTLIVANAGDSRGVLGYWDPATQTWKAKRLTKDHKPDDPEETNRIKSEGGVVFNGRVAGDLAVSRAIGDSVFGKCVSCVPYISHTDISSFERYFVILGCDGLWDVMEDKEAVQAVVDYAKTKKSKYSFAEAATFLVKQAYIKESTDNITVVVFAPRNMK